MRVTSLGITGEGDQVCPARTSTAATCAPTPPGPAHYEGSMVSACVLVADAGCIEFPRHLVEWFAGTDACLLHRVPSKLLKTVISHRVTVLSTLAVARVRSTTSQLAAGELLAWRSRSTAAQRPSGPSMSTGGLPPGRQRRKPIRRDQHQPGTCLSGDCHDVVCW